jgi:hypothetical protein
VEGSPSATWTGVRAPEIRDVDNASWKPGAPVELFNGKDLSGWNPTIPGRELGWAVKDGLMTSLAGANNLASSEKFWNFLLRAEYRYGAKSNSGIGLRGRYEVQIQDDKGTSIDGHSHGSIYSRHIPLVDASLAPGEWQTMEVRLVGRTVTITLNGKITVDRKLIDGLTAMATDAEEALPGPITIQGDHGSVEFRRITVTPLLRKR